MQMVCLWKEGKDCKQKWTVTVPRCRPNKFWCQDYHQQQQQKLTTDGIWTNGKLNYIFDAEFGSLLCSDFWGLMTPLCLFLTKNWDDGSCKSCCRWNGTILDYCSCVPVDLFADWCFVPYLWRNRTVHFSVWGIGSEGWIRIKACFDLRSLRVQEIWNVISTNAVQWQEECSVWSQPKNGSV